MKENENREQSQFVGCQNYECFVNIERIYNVKLQQYGIGYTCFKMKNTVTINKVSDKKLKIAVVKFSMNHTYLYFG